PSTELYPLSLHDALPIFLNRLAYRYIDLFDISDIAIADQIRCLSKIILRTLHTSRLQYSLIFSDCIHHCTTFIDGQCQRLFAIRSEEHTSELQSRENLVC